MFSSEMSKNVSKCTTATFLAFIRPALVFIGRSSIYLATLILIILFNSILMTKWNRLKNPLQVSHRLGFYSKNKDKKNKFCQKKEVKNTSSTWWRKQRQHNNWTLEQTLTNLATKSTISYWRHVIASVNFDNIFHEVHFLKRNLYYASNIPCKNTMWYYI